MKEKTEVNDVKGPNFGINSTVGPQRVFIIGRKQKNSENKSQGRQKITTNSEYQGCKKEYRFRLREKQRSTDEENKDLIYRPDGENYVRAKGGEMGKERKEREEKMRQLSGNNIGGHPPKL